MRNTLAFQLVRWWFGFPMKICMVGRDGEWVEISSENLATLVRRRRYYRSIGFK